MVFDKHNFHVNFSNASGMDTDMAHQILAGEITELVIYNQPAVEDVLRQAGVKVPKKISRKGVLKMLAARAGHDEKMKNTLARMIVANNTPGGESNYSGCGKGCTQDNMGFCHCNKNAPTSNYSGCGPGQIQDYFGHCHNASNSSHAFRPMSSFTADEMGEGPMNFSGSDKDYYPFKLSKNMASSFAHGGQFDVYYSNTAGELASDLRNGIQTGTKSGLPADPVSAVADSLGAFFGFLKSGTDKKIAQEQTRQALINNLTAKESSRQLPPDGAMSPGMKAGLFVAGVLVLGIGTIVIIKMVRK